MSFFRNRHLHLALVYHICEISNKMGMVALSPHAEHHFATHHLATKKPLLKRNHVQSAETIVFSWSMFKALVLHCQLQCPHPMAQMRIQAANDAPTMLPQASPAPAIPVVNSCLSPAPAMVDEMMSDSDPRSRLSTVETPTAKGRRARLNPDDEISHPSFIMSMNN